jgi:hypothetical protein
MSVEQVLSLINDGPYTAAEVIVNSFLHFPSSLPARTQTASSLSRFLCVTLVSGSRPEADRRARV